MFLALAALDEYRRQGAFDQSNLRFLAGAASDAAGVCRTELPQEALIATAACLEEVSNTCTRLINGEDWRTHAPSERHRFLFEDADFDATRVAAGWQLRKQARGARDRLFDRALETLFPSLSDKRITAITLQVIDWYAHADVHSETNPRHAPMTVGWEATRPAVEKIGESGEVAEADDPRD